MDYERYYKGLRIQARVEVHDKAVEIVKRLVPRGGSVLDMAAGEGAFAQRLLDEGYRVSCTSWNNRVRVPEAEVFELNLDEDFGSDDVGSRKYQCLTCIEIIEHLESPSAFLRKIRNLVEDNGIIILSTPNIESGLSRLQILLRGYPLSFSNGEVVKNRHISMLNRQVLDFLLRTTGFEIAERHFLPREPLPIDGLQSLAKFAMFRALRLIMRGEVEGASRLYVLAKGSSPPPTPGDFY